MKIKFTISVHPIPWRRAGRRGERYFTHTKVAEYQEEVIAAFLMAYGLCDLPIFPKDKNVGLKLEFYRSDKRKVDLDNLEKCLMDALEGDLWENDSQIKVKQSALFYDKENPRTEVEAWELEKPNRKGG